MAWAPFTQAVPTAGLRDPVAAPTEQLVALSCDGDDRALSTLLERYYERILRIVRCRLGRDLRTSFESGDVAQEVMLETLRSVHRFEPRGENSFKRWIRGVLENRLRHLARSRARAPRALPLEPAQAAATAGGAEDEEQQEKQQEQRRLLRAALPRLSPVHRRVLVWRHLQQRSFREIGSALDRSEDAAWMLHKRAKAELLVVIDRLRREPPSAP